MIWKQCYPVNVDLKRKREGKNSETSHLTIWNELCPYKEVFRKWMVKTFKEGERKKKQGNFVILLSKANSSSFINGLFECLSKTNIVWAQENN